MKLTVDGIDYKIDNPSDNLMSQLENLEFVMNEILQKNNELQIAETAKMGYLAALRRELKNNKQI